MTKQKPINNLLTFMFCAGCYLLLTAHVHAAKPRVRRSSAPAPKYSAAASTTTVTGFTRASLNRPANSVTITFINVDQTQSSTYTLSYTANGIQQGAVGTVAYTGNNTEVRDLYFGTCSHGVCTAHYNITNASLIIETTTTSGGLYRKKYVIKL